MTKAFFRKFEVYPNTINSDKIEILFISRSSKEKSVETCAHVAKLPVEKGYKDFKLTFVGDKPLMSKMKEPVIET